MNAAGLDEVADIHRREVQYAVKVTVNGTSFIASPNHPIFTQRGWIGAQYLRAGDYTLGAREALSVVRQGVFSEICGAESAEVLRDILLSEMEDESTGTHSETSHSGGCRETRSEEVGMVEIRRSESEEGNGENYSSQSNIQPGNESEDFPPIERDEARTFRTWWKRNGDDSTADVLDGVIDRRMESGVCLVVGETQGRLSHELQTRYSQSCEENLYRGGWSLTPQQEVAGSEERCDVGIFRVDGIEILKPGNPELEEFRDADGHIYFYDIGATRHPSFSVNGLLVHNSSILKSFTGVTKRMILEMFKDTPFRSAWTATPAPNDHLELGNHADFLGIMPSNEMIMRWFVADSMQAGGYRLKRHGAADYWRWVCSWAVSVTTPADLGYDDTGYILPPLCIEPRMVDADVAPAEGELVAAGKLSATQIHRVGRQTAEARAAEAGRIVAANPDVPWVIWCNTDYEADAVCRHVEGIVNLKGSEHNDVKTAKLIGFSDGSISRICTKGKIAGFGLNWQHCANVIFVGLGYSYEMFYQSLRRTWRFGQTKPVEAYVLLAEEEQDLLSTIQRKQADHEEMKREMTNAMLTAHQGDMDDVTIREHIETDVQHGKDWTLYLGDSCQEISKIADNSVGLTVSSCPFNNLYIYSDSIADMGNCTDNAEFIDHFRYLARELFRVTMDGRLCVIHCKDLPLYMNRDDAAGLFDFPGSIIKMFGEEGWTYHSRVTIWKDPVIEMERTKNYGLLYCNLRANACVSRQGMADYLVVFRKWTGAVQEDSIRINAVNHTKDEFPLEQWQKWASPVWMDIQQTDVLNGRLARDGSDERHICPLQLDLIERCIRMWSNPRDLVLDPFNGIGSTGYEALKCDRRYVGIELKRGYYEQAIKFLRDAEANNNTLDLFGDEVMA